MRKRLLYLRLAISNLWKNRQTYLSFFLSTVCTIFVFYTFSMIALNDGIKKMRGANAMQVMMVLGAVVVAIFAFAFLFYANSFLIKRRKKELGLYAILGMEKKHIARVLFHEMTVLLLLSLLAGIGLGIALSKLMFLLVQALMRIPTPIVFQINTLPLFLTFGLFVAVFFLLLLYNRLQVHLSSPVHLLKGQQKGEREPKTRWLLALIGVVTMAAGYIIANRVENPLMALAIFFAAVILVIIGTYALFTAGSIAVLKLLRHKKGFYYKPGNFISVSGMIYRMKQNAAGLAGICILSTMAIITIGTTAALYIGQESVLRAQNPTDQMVAFAQGEIPADEVEEMIRQVSEAHHVEITEMYSGVYTQASAYREKNLLAPVDNDRIKTMEAYKNVWTVYFMPLQAFNQMAGTAYTLEDGQALAFQTRRVEAEDTLSLGGTAFSVKEYLAAFPIDQVGRAPINPTLYLVVKDRETAAAAFDALLPGSAEAAVFEQGFWWNTKGTEDNLMACSQAIRDGIRLYGKSFSASSIDAVRQEWYAMYGGFLFLGVFLGLLFLMATTLIIYFKQVSEGYMDHDRFIILQKVGMSRDEVKRTVRKQILMVFILPIIAAILHTWGALHMMSAMLLMFGLADTGLIAISIFATAGVFALLYGLVYTATAKTYYGMVRMDG